MFVKRFIVKILIISSFVNISAQVDRKAEAEKLITEGEGLFAKKTKADLQEALPKFEQALKICEEINELKCQATAINRLAEISYLIGNGQKALEYVEQVLPLFQELGDKVMEAETFNNIGAFNYELGNFREAIKNTEKSVEILQELGDKNRTAIALGGLGVFYSNLGEKQTAIDYLNKSLVLRREVKDRSGEARTLNNIATIYDDTGEKRKATEIYQEALKISRDEKDKRIEAITLNNLGLAWKQLGEYQKSLNVYRESLELRKLTGDKRGEAITLSNIAGIYRDLGDVEEALKISEQTLQTFQEGGYKRNEAITLGSIASIYSDLGDKKKEIETRQKSLEIYVSIEDKGGQATALKSLGLIYAENNEHLKAIEKYQMSLALAEEIDELQLVALVKLALARSLENLKDYDIAEENYALALEISKKVGNPDNVVESLYYYAQFQKNTGNQAQALEKMSESLQILEDLRNTISNEAFRIGFFSRQQKYYDFYLSLLVSQHFAEPKKGFDSLALIVSEKARARSLLDSLGESRLNNNTGVSTELIQKEKTLRQKIKFKETQRLNELKQNKNDKVSETEKEISELIQDHWNIRTEIRQQNPQFASLIQPEEISLKKIQEELLDNNTVLLEYFLGSEKSYLFFVTKTTLEIIPLPKREEIEKTSRLYIEGLKADLNGDLIKNLSSEKQESDNDDNKWKEQGKILSKILLGSISDKIKNKRLLIVSSGILQYIPFAALENSVQKNKGTYLIETNEIINLPSASVMSVLRSNKKQNLKKHDSIAILADPVFSKEDIRIKTFAKQSSKENAPNSLVQAGNSPRQLRSDFSRLRFSRKEAEEITKFAQKNQTFIALDFAANRNTALSPDVQNARVIHFATHGIINSQFPELSGVILSLIDENGKPQDGFLRLHDIYNLRINSDLVVLSACESALGKEIKGEGIIGLSRGFMYAGTQSVVASLWKVEDRATAELMKKFYRAMLKNKQKPAAALRTAQIEMLQDERWNNPFYWAAFTLQGEWQ